MTSVHSLHFKVQTNPHWNTKWGIYAGKRLIFSRTQRPRLDFSSWKTEKSQDSTALCYYYVGSQTPSCWSWQTEHSGVTASYLRTDGAAYSLVVTNRVSQEHLAQVTWPSLVQVFFSPRFYPERHLCSVLKPIPPTSTPHLFCVASRNSSFCLHVYVSLAHPSAHLLLPSTSGAERATTGLRNSHRAKRHF